MRQIQKRMEPKEITDWKSKFKKKNGREPNYGDLTSDSDAGKKQIKAKLKEALLQEQYYLCCYCCAQITMESSHIEHFRPKGKQGYEKLSLAYENMHACCKVKGQCGDKKGSNFDEKLMISPLSRECETSYSFGVGGEILVSCNEGPAEYTKELLDLNSERLKNARRAAMWAAEVFDVEDEQERQNLIAEYSTPEAGELVPFCDIILYQLKNGEF